MAGRKPGTKKTGGRKKGVPNKLTGDVKAMILAALDEAGGTKYLLTQARTNPNAFMTLVGKVLPMQITGKDGGKLEVEHSGGVELEPGEAYLRLLSRDGR